MTPKNTRNRFVKMTRLRKPWFWAIVIHGLSTIYIHKIIIVCMSWCYFEDIEKKCFAFLIQHAVSVVFVFLLEKAWWWWTEKEKEGKEKEKGISLFHIQCGPW